MTQPKTDQIIKKFAFVAVFLALLVPPVTAQEILPLWENDIPGELASKSYKEEQRMENGQLVMVSKVTEPTMTVYKADQPNGTAVVICPGGGYGLLAIDKEGFKIAEWLNERGITAFVLKYRLPSDLIMKDKSIGPLQDAQRAIRMVRQHAAQFNIDTAKVGIMGFSAGGHLASTLSTHYNDNVYTAEDSISARPDFSILLYPVISMKGGLTHQGSRDNLLGKAPSTAVVEQFSNEEQVTKKTPPAFIVHAADDGAVPVANSIDYFTSLNKHDVPAEIHIYEQGGHGFGLGTQATSNAWPEALALWLKSHKLTDSE